MQFLMYALFISVFSLDYLHYCLKVTPLFTTLVPELISLTFILVICIQAAVKNKIWISMGYLAVFVSYCIFMICGGILNELSYGPVVLGIRSYLRFMPIFFLPAVFDFSIDDIIKHLKFLLILLLIQFPVALYQRFILFRAQLTGDVVTGTLWVSGDLSIVLLCAASIVIALLINKQIKVSTAIIIIACLFIPTTLNETKISLVILPIIILVPGLIYKERIGTCYRNANSKIKVLTGAGLIFLILIPSFITIYDMMLPQSRSGIVEIFQRELEGRGYYFTGAKSYHQQVFGRGDAIRLAFSKLSHDPLALAFGLGMGNVMDTSIKELRGKHTGARNPEFDYKGQNIALTYMLWELGLAGFLMYFVLHILILKDALFLRNVSGYLGSLSLGWISVVIVMMVCFIYTNTIRSNPISVLFWYFSGLISAKAYRLRAVQGYRPVRQPVAGKVTPVTS